MRKFLIPIALMSAVAMAAPASAQRGFDQRYDQLAYQVDRAAQSGQLTNRQARSLYQQIRSLDRLERSYSRGGFTRYERQQINDRFHSIRSQIRSARGNNRYYDRHDDDRRWDGRRDRDDDD